jgi:hypothetical protein
LSFDRSLDLGMRKVMGRRPVLPDDANCTPRPKTFRQLQTRNIPAERPRYGLRLGSKYVKLHASASRFGVEAPDPAARTGRFRSLCFSTISSREWPSSGRAFSRDGLLRFARAQCGSTDSCKSVEASFREIFPRVAASFSRCVAPDQRYCLVRTSAKLTLLFRNSSTTATQATPSTDRS